MAKHNNKTPKITINVVWVPEREAMTNHRIKFYTEARKSEFNDFLYKRMLEIMLQQQMQEGN